MATIKNFKYKLVKNFLTKEETELAKKYILIKHKNNRIDFDFAQNNNSDTIFYRDPFGESLLLNKKNLMEKETNLDLFPTYSFTRLYTYNSELKPHKDRPSCEISVTVMFGSDGTKWPIYMDDKEIILEAGDCVIYSGTKIAHWREEFFGDWYAQVFLHWVLKNGKHKEFYKDKRHYFGMPR